MQAIQCPNCGYLTVYKRRIGFLTILAILLTGGFWALFIPLYSKRCTFCGHSYSQVSKQNRKSAQFQINILKQQKKAIGPLGTQPPFGFPQKNQQFANRASDKPGAVHSTLKQKRPVLSSSDSLWLRKGKSVNVAGYHINNGMIYVGENLKGSQGWGTESALINPKLKIDKSKADWAGVQMTYWPSYSEIAPACRAAFLSWLSNGFNHSDAYIGYVFLYFYGLERRALVDSKQSQEAKEDIPLIIEEVNRLLDLYGEKSSSFRKYAKSFLDVLNATNVQNNLYLTEPPKFDQSYDFPIKLKVALAQTAVDKVPLPANWALAWVMSRPFTSFRTPAERCCKEFSELFRIQYETKFGNGMVLKPGQERLTVSYHAANGSMGGAFNYALSAWPEVTHNGKEFNKLCALAESSIDEIDAFSRYIGRNKDKSESMEALALLPSPLLQKSNSSLTQNMSDWLGERLETEEYVLVRFDDLLNQVSLSANEINKKLMAALAQFLSKLGMGMEPDVRFGSPYKNVKEIVLFKKLPNAPNVPSPEYSVAALILHLAASVSGADGQVTNHEEEHLEGQLESWMHLADEERKRLKAHTKWLMSNPPNLSGIKKRLEDVSEDQKEAIARFMVDVAQADGLIDSREMKILEKIFKLLSLKEEELYSWAHSAASEPVTAQSSSFNETKYTIPQPDTINDQATINDDLIKAKLAETAAVTALLSNIFIDEEEQHPVESQIDSTIPGLDTEQIAFAKVLIQKNEWSREDLEIMASESDLMLDGLLEAINEAAYDLTDQPFFEGDDPLEINQMAVKELFNDSK